MPSPTDILPAYVNPDTEGLDYRGFNAMIAVCRAVQRIHGVPPIRVRLEANGIKIAIDQRTPSATNTPGRTWEWARILQLLPVEEPTYLRVYRLNQETGEPISGEQVDVRCMAGSNLGTVLDPHLADCSPVLIPYLGMAAPDSGLVQITNYGVPPWTNPAFTVDLSGWWYCGPVPLMLSCY